MPSPHRHRLKTGSALLAVACLLSCSVTYDLEVVYDGGRPTFHLYRHGLFGVSESPDACVHYARLTEEGSGTVMWEIGRRDMGCLPYPLHYGETAIGAEVLVPAATLRHGTRYEAVLFPPGGAAMSSFVLR